MVDKCICMMYNACCTKAEAAESISTTGMTSRSRERGFRRRNLAAGWGGSWGRREYLRHCHRNGNAMMSRSGTTLCPVSLRHGDYFFWI